MFFDSTADSITSMKNPREAHPEGPQDLLSEAVYRKDGIGPVMDLGSKTGKLLVLTLGISHVVEQAGLTVSIWGSSDGTTWEPKPLTSFPQKYYCGLYSVLLNMAKHPDVRYLRAQWSMKSWSKIGKVPMFSFHLFFEESGSRITTAVA